MYTEPLAGQLAVVDALHPVSKSAAAYNGAAVNMLYFHRVLYLLDVGVISSSGTVDFKLNASATSGFSSNADLTGKAITQLTQAGSNSNSVAKVGAVSEDLAIQTTPSQYVRYVLTVGTAAALVQIAALAGRGRYKPENSSAVGQEIAAVVQTISD